MIYTLLFILATLVIFHVSTRYNRRGRLLNRIPGPAPIPIFGNTLLFNVSGLDEFWNIGRKYSKLFYPISKYWICTTALVNVAHPDDLEILMSSQKTIEKAYLYDYIKPWLKTGLLTSTGAKWRQRRKMLTPAFHFSVLKKYIDITNEQGQKLIETLKAAGKETVQSTMPFCLKYSLNIICESAMGVSLDSLDESSVDKYKQAVHDFGNTILYRFPRPYIHEWMMPYVYKIGSMRTNALKVLFKFTDDIINERKEYHKRADNVYLKEFNEDVERNRYDINSTGKKRRLAMLDLLLAAQQNGLIDDDGIKEEVDTFLFEGHDTTGMAMTFLLILLAENKEAQDLARAEVTEMLDRTDGKIEIKDLQEMNYLERCIKESLRLYPPVSMITRYTAEDLQLKNALVPAGTHIMIQIWDTHRDPDAWPNPEKFDPDRFLPENSKNRHPYAYVPFSAGPRNCIGNYAFWHTHYRTNKGIPEALRKFLNPFRNPETLVLPCQKFAMMELKSLLAQILYDFYIEPVDRLADMQLIADIVIRPQKPFRIKLIKIDK